MCSATLGNYGKGRATSSVNPYLQSLCNFNSKFSNKEDTKLFF